MSETVKAPWTVDQVEALNWFQWNSGWHPFTCGNERHDVAHTAYQSEMGGDWGQLIATTEGWVCPVCDYRQEWCSQWMIDCGIAKRNPMKEYLSACEGGVSSSPAPE